MKIRSFCCRINDIAELTRDPIPLLHSEMWQGTRRLIHSFWLLQGRATRPATYSP